MSIRAKETIENIYSFSEEETQILKQLAFGAILQVKVCDFELNDYAIIGGIIKDNQNKKNLQTIKKLMAKRYKIFNAVVFYNELISCFDFIRTYVLKENVKNEILKQFQDYEIDLLKGELFKP